MVSLPYPVTCMSLHTLLEFILHRTQNNFLFIYNHPSHILMSDTSSSEGEFASLASASLADSALKIEDFREGLKQMRGNAREDIMI